MEHVRLYSFLIAPWYWDNLRQLENVFELNPLFLQCIEFLGPNCFTPDQYSKLVTLMKDALEMCFSRASERQAQRHDEDYDEQVEEELEEEVRSSLSH